MRRLAPAVIIFVSLLLIGVAQAQTCPPPVIIVVAGANPSCAGQPVTLDAGAGWATYQWSPGGATTRMISDSPSETMAYAVTTTDANGCSVTSQPLTVVVNSAAFAPPAIQGAPAGVCPSGSGSAWIDTPSPDYTTIAWSATNGTITGGASGHNVVFQADGSGLPVVATVAVSDANGCPAQSSVTIPIGTIPTPAINATSQICTTDTGNANVSPTPGSTWDWSATNATITGTFDGQGQPDPHGSQIWYVPLGPGTVILSVVEHAATGCSGTATRNVTVQPPAVTDFTVTATCPGGVGSASAVLNGYTFYSWSIANGSFIGTTANQRTVSFRMSSDPANPSVITLTAGNGPGSCVAPATHSVPVATLASPSIVLFPDSGICAGNGVTAYTASSGYDTYHWTISNGTIYSGASSYLINYSATAGGPTTLFLTVTKNGCSSSSSTVIPVADTTPQPITAPDSICPTGTFTASAPAGYINYRWTYGNALYISGSGTGNAITLRPSGTGLPIQLSVSMQTTGFCNVAASSKTVPIAATSVPQIAFDVPAGFCGGITGSASVANGPYPTYLWSVTGGVINGPNNGPAISFSADSSGSTTVAVTVTDGRGDCSSTNSASAPFVNPKPQINVTSFAICSGGNTTLSTQAPAGSYLWSTGQTTPSISVTAVGDYTVTTTTGGCSFTSAPVHIALSTPSATVSANFASHCPGANSMLTAIVSGMTGFIRTYTWYATDQQTAILSGRDFYQLFAGSPTTRTFYCVVSDERGCSVRSNDLTINVYTPTAVITPSGPTTFCAGGNVTLTANVGSSYSWSNGATTRSITVTSSGSYNVYVIDTNGCGKQSTSTTVTVNPLPATPAITAGGPTTFCAGGSVTLTAPASSSYLWSTGATTQAIAVSAAGSYSVTVTNGNGCSAASASTAVTVNALPTATITAAGPTTFCPGGSVTLTASSGASYLWSTGATSSSITATAGGSYSVTVTGTNGCSTTSAPAAVTVNANPIATITASGPATLCAGGSVTLTASAGASYLWSTGAATQSITVNSSGTYSVAITNAAGCLSTSAPLSITSSTLSATTSASATTICDGQPAILTASATGGSAPYTYQWSNGAGLIAGATSQSYTATVFQGYYVTVSDAIGCTTTTAQQPIIVNVNPSPSSYIVAPANFCSGGTYSVGTPDGSFTSYAWSVTNGTLQSSNRNTAVIVAGTSGSVTVQLTVTNSYGCSWSGSQAVPIVSPPPIPVITASGPRSFCQGGQVTLTAPAGYSYIWHLGTYVYGTTQSVTVSDAGFSGSYTLTVTNAGGCSATSEPITVVVNANPATPVITASGPTTFCAGGSATLTAPASSSYLWSTGATTQSISVNSGGSYSVTVTNGSGCAATSSPTVVTVNANPTASITVGGPTTFCAGGSVTLTASGGSSYLWSTGATTSSIIASSSGSYSATVTNANGCSATSSPTAVTVNASPVASITAGGPTTFCAGGSVTLTASGGSSYLWSTGATSSSIIASVSGSYRVTVTDANGCSATSSPTAVTVNANPTASITAGGPTTFCAGGSVTLTASGGTSYLWSTGATSSSIIASVSGSYSVTVTDANGCSANSSPTAVTVNANPTVSITAGGPTTFCAGGSVTLTASSGSSYLWSNGATTSSITVSAGGSYSVTVTNANGCSATSTPTVVTVNANPTASIAAGGPTTFCAGGSVTLTASAGASYLWSTGATTSTITVSAGGSYSVTVTTASGCSATSTPTAVTVNPNATASITPGGPTTFCAGGSVTLTASAGASYLWSTGATTSTITVSAGGSYSVTVTTASGCSATSTPTAVTVNANPAASITAGGATTFCAGGGVTLTASSGSSYLWSTGATTPSITVSAGGSYSVTVTNAAGCSTTSAPTVVTVNAKPTPTITAGGPTAICPGGSVTLTASSGTSYLWSNGVTTPSISATAAGSYSVTVTNASGCSATSAPVTVTVKTLPTATVSGGGAICPGGSSTISAALTGTAPWSVTWSDGNIQTINSGTTATRSVSPASTTSYTVTSVSDAASCPRAGSGTATVTVNAPASITTQPVNKTTTRNTSVTLTVVAAGTSPISYQWFKGNGTSISGATSSSYTTSFTGKGTNTFYVEVWNSCNTTHVKSTTVTVTVN